MKLPRVRFTVRRMTVTAAICVATFGGFTHRVISPSEARAGDPDEARRAQIKDYYPRWVGVRAPELGQAGRDHSGKPVTLSSFRGKRVLLFSFDAGDFHRAPDEKA